MTEDAVEGETVTEVTAGPVGEVGPAVTVTVAAPVFVESATLVAVTMSVPAFAGAVYWPLAVIAPRSAFQVTDLLEVDP